MAHAEVILIRDGCEVPLGCLGLGRPCDLGLIDELAQMQLMARRRGCSLRLRGTSVELTELLALTGLAEVLPSEPASAADQLAGQDPSKGTTTFPP